MLLRSKGARISPKLTTEFGSVVLMVPASTAWKMQDWESNGSFLCGFRKHINPGNVWQIWSLYEKTWSSRYQTQSYSIWCFLWCASVLLLSDLSSLCLHLSFSEWEYVSCHMYVGIMEFGFVFYRKSVKRLPCVSKDNLKFWTVVRLLKMMRTFDCIRIWPRVHECYGQNMVLCLGNVPYQCSSWNLLDLEPCWRKHVTGGRIWGFITLMHFLSFLSASFLWIEM